LLIGNAITAIEKGNALVAGTAETMDNVYAHSKQTGEIVINIAKASTEQAKSVESVKGNIGEISDVVVANSAMSKENTASANELSAMAEKLGDLVSWFKLS
jgi:methyl-accepting chemotaxis protein